MTNKPNITDKHVVTKTKICETEDTEGNVHAGYHEIREKQAGGRTKINPSYDHGE